MPNPAAIMMYGICFTILASSWGRFKDFITSLESSQSLKIFA